MNALIEAKMNERIVLNLCVVTTFESGKTFKYFARNTADRDNRIAFVSGRIGRIEHDGEIIKSVAI